MLRSNFVYNPALKCMSYNGEVLEITLNGFAMAGRRITKFQNSIKDEYRTKC